VVRPLPELGRLAGPTSERDPGNLPSARLNSVTSHKRMGQPLVVPAPAVPVRGLDVADLRAAIAAIVPEFKEFVQKRIRDSRIDAKNALDQRFAEEIRPLVLKVDVLERRLAEFEQCGMRYAGIFSRVCSYDRGSVVSHSGASWFCLCSHTGLVPGQAPDAWIMISKGSPKPASRPHADRVELNGKASHG
jgi:hypothetical protein